LGSNSYSELPREQRFSVDLGLRGQVPGDVECHEQGAGFEFAL
jgi:hypothetical protein